MRRLISTSASAAVVALAVSAFGTGGLAQAKTTGHAAASKISVQLSDYKFKFSSTTLAKPGSVTFKLTNKGKTTHDLKINGKTSAKIAAGKTGTLTVTFKKKGNYKYECTLPGHAALGMKGTFKVK